MNFNVEKCKVMHIGRKNAEGDYYMNGKLLVVEEEKDLGIWLRKDLKASAQCNYAYQKANRVLGMIRRNIVYKTPSIMVRLYKSLVRPHLEYGMVAWAPHYEKDKIRLESIQRRFSRMVWGLEGMEWKARVRKLGLMSLEERRNRADLIELFRMVKGSSSIPLEKFFELDSSRRTRGHGLKLRKLRFGTDLRKHFFSNRVVDVWNGLDNEVVSVDSVNRFKNGLLRNRAREMDLLKD